MRHYSRRGFLVGAAAAVAGLPLALTGCGSRTATHSDVKIAMGYIANVQFAPMYLALEKGYFEQENLGVDLDYGWETDILSLVGTNQLQFAIASGDQIVLARAQGLPVVYVFDWYQRFPVTVASLAASNITKPDDLIGKRVGTPAIFGSSYIGWRALLFALGIPEDRIELQTIGYTQVAALTSGQVDAALCFYMNEPVQLRQAGQQVNQILVADYIQLPAAGIITNEATIENDPQLVERVVRAFSRGLKDTLSTPDDAFAAAEKAVPEIASSRDTQRAVLAASVELWNTDAIGVSDEAAWQAAADFMKQAGLVDVSLRAADLFTNRFVPEAS
ncbi:MAG: ABC transporter substrate-binding protein [Anaerolineae bacterium]